MSVLNSSARALYGDPVFETRKIAKLRQSEVKGDVLDRLDGLEDYVDYETGNKIYYPKTIKRIFDDLEDDTNEITKCRLEDLYEQVKDSDMIIIVND